jgi:hypothetical protein
MTLTRYSEYRPPFVSHTLRETLKDIIYKQTYGSIKNNYILIHVAKAGGSFLKDILSKYVDCHIGASHEKKLIHFSPSQQLIIPIRDPVSRFESSFYSYLHKRSCLTAQQVIFYDKYPDVNVYVKALSVDPVSTLDFAFKKREVAMLGRFSKLAFWLHSPRMIERKASQIHAVIRQESIEEDLITFFESLGINMNLEDLDSTTKYSKPKDRFPKLNQANTLFLKRFLLSEYEIANKLLEIGGFSPYL